VAYRSWLSTGQPGEEGFEKKVQWGQMRGRAQAGMSPWCSGERFGVSVSRYALYRPVHHCVVPLLGCHGDCRAGELLGSLTANLKQAGEKVKDAFSG
jgi:hypothetical protein